MSLVWQAVGPDTVENGCASAAIQSSNGKTIGKQTFCGETFSIGPSGDGIYTGHATYALPGGTINTTFAPHVQTISSFDSGPLALPPDVQAQASQWIAFVGDHTITGGTKRYARAKGSLRDTGFFVTDANNLALLRQRSDIATLTRWLRLESRIAARPAEQRKILFRMPSVIGAAGIEPATSRV